MRDDQLIAKVSVKGAVIRYDREGSGRDFFPAIFSWPSEFCFKILMPQLKIIEIFHTAVSLVVEAIVPKARHAMTICHCIVQLGL